ncbi:unnamed protein product, partial [Nesidiocoris tenuis]
MEKDELTCFIRNEFIPLQSLPKIEAELKVKLIAYYDKYDAPFLWHGANLLQKIFDDFKDKTATVCTPRTR